MATILLQNTLLSVTSITFAEGNEKPNHEVVEYANLEDEYSLFSTKNVSYDALNLDSIPDKLYSNIMKELENSIILDEDTYADLFTIQTENNDGTKTVLVFEEPIKYYNEDTDKVCFINNEFIAQTNNDNIAFKNQGNSYNAEFSSDISNGIALSDKNYSVNMTPCNTKENISPQMIDDTLIYDNAFDENTDIYYEL